MMGNLIRLYIDCGVFVDIFYFILIVLICYIGWFDILMR